ncbi:CRISPR-associated protein Cas4 [Geoglobus acetivorans]|uniref:CRISPR-associated exonuclease Cas4 n=1 Tax=Geoglobus acetivorans TaxID=565033 RepID=A0ABZ3H1G1_GEOAI|nr:CRISPR-associated protein Cas4 [Geoglobus acetivorans]
MRMTSYSFEFPVSMVKQYLYCPRIPYFILVLGFKERTTELMKYGKEEHEKRMKKLERKGWKTNVYLKSERFGIYGYVDGLRQTPDGYEVYEFKNSEYRKKSAKIHLYQTACYALLVEDNFGRVVKLVVGYRDGERESPFSLGVRRYAASIINKIHHIHETGLVSSPRDRSRCRGCGYRKICKEL